MADAAAAESRADGPTPDSADDFEFCILSSGGIVPAGKQGAGTETDMCVADELFCQGKLLPLRASSAASAADGASVATLPRSESAASTVGLVSRSGSRSASSSGSSSGCVSRSESSKSASSDQGVSGGPPRRSLSSSVFYAHPSPSPQLRSARPRRSTGSAAQQPAAAWGLFRLGVVGAPDVYPPPPPRPAADTKVSARGGGSRSARFEPVATAVDKKLGLVALVGDGLGCKCSPDVIEPVRTMEAAKRGRKKDGAKSGGQGIARRSRILDWLEELSIVKDKK